MNNDTLNKYDRLSTHILRKNIEKFRKYTIYAFLVLITIIGFQSGIATIHAMSDKVIAVCPDSGCEFMPEVNPWTDWFNAGLN